MENQNKEITRREITIDLSCVEHTLLLEEIKDYLEVRIPERIRNFEGTTKQIIRRVTLQELFYVYFDIISSIKRNVI